MTKEEAIKLLSLLPMTVVDADFNGSTVEAINIAIEALRQYDTESLVIAGDCIEHDGETYIKLSDVEKCIDRFKRQPERPKGRWMCVYDEMMGETDVTCSHCGNTRTINGCYVSHDGESIYYNDHFCPNCGSDNRGEEE